MFSSQASRKTKKKEGGALRAQRASSNVFSNFEQTQIQEFKEVRLGPHTGSPSTQKLLSRGPRGTVMCEPRSRASKYGCPSPHDVARPIAMMLVSSQAFTLMDQNRDGFIDKEDLKDTYASLGRCQGPTG